MLAVVVVKKQKFMSKDRAKIIDKIRKNEEKIKALKMQNSDLYYENLLLSDETQKYIEEEREVVVTKRPKVTKKVLFGMIQWNEDFRDDDTGEVVIIERHKIVKEDGVWVV